MLQKPSTAVQSSGWLMRQTLSVLSSLDLAVCNRKQVGDAQASGLHDFKPTAASLHHLNSNHRDPSVTCRHAKKQAARTAGELRAAWLYIQIICRYCSSYPTGFATLLLAQLCSQ